jgi:hypothetical protein
VCGWESETNVPHGDRLKFCGTGIPLYRRLGIVPAAALLHPGMPLNRRKGRSGVTNSREFERFPETGRNEFLAIQPVAD